MPALRKCKDNRRIRKWLKKNTDDALKEAFDDLKHISNALFDAIEDEKLNNLTKGE
jgi:hypothetical protein